MPPQTPRMNLVGKMLGAEVILEQGKMNCPSQWETREFSTVLELETKGAEFLAFGAQTKCVRSSCGLLVMGLSVHGMTEADKRTLQVIYDYLVDSGLLGIAHKNAGTKGMIGF